MKEYNGNYMAFGPRPDLEPKECEVIKPVREMNVVVNLSDLFWDSKKNCYDKLDLSKATRAQMMEALAHDAEELIMLHNIEGVTQEKLVDDFMDRR